MCSQVKISNSMEATKPLFSILIPTKARPELVKDAICSVLLQDCPASTYELVVSNNGGCPKTKSIVESFQRKYPIRYIQPDQVLNMPDHWEWAARQLLGRYVLILPDRRMLRQGALSLLAKLIRESTKDIEVVTWPDADLSESGVLIHNGNGEGFITFQSESVLKKWTQENLDNTFLPLGLNSCVKHEVLNKIREEKGRVYSPISPDISSAFSILYVTEDVVRSNKYLTIAQGVKYSNGWNGMLGDTSYIDLLKEDGIFKYIPIKDYLVWGSIYEDLFRAAHALNKKIEWKDINPVFFYTRCWQEIMLKRINQPFSPQVKILITDFQDALSRETPDRRLAVQLAMKRMVLRPLYAKRLLVKMMGQSTASRIRAVYHKLSGGKLYSCGLEASGFAQPYCIPSDTKTLD